MDVGSLVNDFQNLFDDFRMQNRPAMGPIAFNPGT